MSDTEGEETRRLRWADRDDEGLVGLDVDEGERRQRRKERKSKSRRKRREGNRRKGQARER